MISIIIVGYNSEKYLDDCLSSIFASTYKNFKIIFVDNDSKDNSISLIKNKFPKIEIIESKENLGFAEGNNCGIKLALKLNTDFLFFLNPDTVIKEDCLELLMQNKHSEILLQPLVLIHNGKKKTDLVNTSGGILNFLGFSYCGEYKKRSGEITVDKDIAVGSGAALFCPAEIIKKIGFFDKKFFMYHEDVDFSWRARMAGYDIKLVANALVWHKYSFSKNKKKMFYADRNRLLFLHKNFSLKYRILILPIFVLNEILMILYSLLGGWFTYKIKSYISAIKLISMKKKQEHKVSMKYLKQFIAPDISFPEITNSLFLPYNIILKLYWKLIYSLI